MMKRLMFLILSLAVLIGMGLATSAAIAGDGIYGQMRWRWEGFKNYNFNSDVKDNWGQNLLRSRIGYKTTIGEHGLFKMAVENTHILGGDWGYYGYDPFNLYMYEKQAQPESFGEDVYINEAIVGIKDFATEGLDLYGGRMCLAYGNQRIIGPDDWAMNHENRFDGFKSHYKFEDGWFDLLCIWLYEAGPYKWMDGYGDINLRGLYGHYDVNEQFYFEPYILWVALNNNDYYVGGVEQTGLDTDSIFLFGALLDYLSDTGLHVYAEGTIESGTFHDFAPAPDTDWSALGAYGGAFYTVDNEMEPFLGVEFNYASGTTTDDFNDDKIKTFVSPFGSFSNYMGRMNFVGWSNTASFRFSGGLTPTEGLDFKVDFYLFKLAKDEDAAYVNLTGDMLYNESFAAWPGVVNADGVFDKSVGTEIDVFLNYNVEENVDVEAGFGLFSPGDYFGPDADLDSALFGWLGAQVAFP